MARFDLGLTDDEIGRLNLKEYDALCKRAKTADNKARLNAGLIAAAVQNSAMGDPDRKAINPLEYVPDWKYLIDKDGDLTKMTPEQQRDYLLNTFTKSKMLKR